MFTRTYTITIRLNVDEGANEQLQTEEGVKAELVSWLTDLGAEVEVLALERETEQDV